MKGSSVLQQKIDPLTGQSEWVIMQEEGAVEELHDSLAHTSYLDMLNDSHRNYAFEAAISSALRASPGLVLDIGAGTGLLSMMASRSLREAALASSDRMLDKPVIACEAFLPMYLLAQKVLHLNGFTSSVKLVHKRSEEMKVGIDMGSLADVLVTEILDSTLLGEGLIPTLQHAHDHLLKPNAVVIPHKATIFGQLVQSNELRRMQDLQGVESQLKDGLVFHPPHTEQNTLLKQMQHAMHVNALADSMDLMTQPFKVFEFEFAKRPSSHSKADISVKALRTGVVHAVISWWVLELDQKGSEVYSTAPKWVEQSQHFWQDHWKQCVWFVPSQGLNVVDGEVVQVYAFHDQISFKYDLSLARGLVDIFKTAKSNTWMPFMRPERIRLLGSSKWRSVILAALKRILRDDSPLCLVVDDSLPLSIAAAATSSSASVVSLLPGIRNLDFNFVHSLIKANGLNTEQVKVVQKKANELTVDDFGGRKVNVLLGEPYYLACEDMLPWRNLRFWKERTCLATLLDENAIIVPWRGMLYGMAMSMHDLWRSRRALKSVHGFNHSLVNKVFGACGDLPMPLEGPILPFHLWQCGEYQKLTDPFPIMAFEFSKAIETVKASIKVHIASSGICHGIIMWIDWVLHPESEKSVCTGPGGDDPSCWKQGVKLLRSPVLVERFPSKDGSLNPSMFELHALFDSESGNLQVNVDFAKTGDYQQHVEQLFEVSECVCQGPEFKPYGCSGLVHPLDRDFDCS